MENGDFVRVNYVGRIKENNEIFDLTDEEIAKKEGVYNPRIKYGPVPIIFGADMILKSLEEEIKKMNVGEKKKIELKSEQAFGQRDTKLIKIFTEKQFKEQDMRPVPGLIVEINDLRGRVLSVNAGRVKVDFNHPLSGKDLSYDVEIVVKIEKSDDKIKSVVQYYTGIEPGLTKVVITEKTASIELPSKVNIPGNVRETIANETTKWLKDVEKVKFEETFEKKP
jgi:FKBP-type peptidyl-prolyl cis-trans isomerase 2